MTDMLPGVGVPVAPPAQGVASGLPLTQDLPMASVPQPQGPNVPASPVGGFAKEQGQVSERVDQAESSPLVETREPEKLPEEVEGWLEKLERGEDIKLPQPVVSQGQTVVTAAEPDVTEDKLVLPMTEESMQKGLTMRLVESARWLAVWCARIIKKFPGGAVFHQT